MYAELFTASYGLEVVALRYFNVYGPRQSLSNPYTGAAAIFSSRIKNGNPPLIFEDGLQRRDFVSAYDVGALVSAKGIAEGVSNSNWLIETSGSDGSGARYVMTMYERRIDPADLPHVFDRFWQARESRRGGAGLPSLPEPWPRRGCRAEPPRGPATGSGH